MSNIFEQALVAHQAGDFPRAEQLYRKILAAHPKDFDALHMLGVVHAQGGRLPEAARLIGRALKIRPDDPQALYNLGNALLSMDRLEEALACFDRVLAASPGYADAHNNRGIVLQKMDRLDDSLDSYDKALTLNPHYADAHNNRGNVLQKMNRLDESLESYDKALALKPDYADAHNNRGYVLHAMNRFDEALVSYEKALKIRPGYVEAYNNQGKALSALGRSGEAVASFNEALRLQPDDHGAKLNLAIELAYNGDYEAARALCQEAITLKPDFALGYHFFSTLKKFTPQDPQIAKLEALLNAVDSNGTESMHLNFALAKAYEDIEEVDRAFACLQRGNRIRKIETGYRIDDDRQTFSLIKSLFQDGPLEEADAGQGDKQPVFIVGMPRSGTTLVEQVLASHSKMHGAGELVYLRNLVWPILGEAAKNPRCLTEGGRIEALRAGYLAKLEALKVTERQVIDKEPGNFLCIGFIFAAFPEARVINVNRNPIAVGWSLYKHHFSASHMNYSCDLSDIAEYIGLYSDLMTFWDGLFPNRIHHVDYETLTEDQEKETRRLLAYCGLDWEDACLDFQNTERVVRSISNAQVRQAMYTGSSEAWLPFKPHLGPLIDAFGR